jgi:hypothetical protein
MRQLLIVLIFLPGQFQLFAQKAAERLPVSIGYYSNYGFQPGLKVGTEFTLAGDSLKRWIISPQMGMFANPGDDRHTVLNLEVGRRRPKAGKTAYSTWSAGLGYLRQSKLRSYSVNLGSGKTSDSQRVNDAFVLPTISYEYGWGTHRKTSWDMNYAWGTRLLGNNEHSMMLLLEFGVKLNWKKTL